MNILLNVQYDGTDFCGFQRQPNKRTVQGEIESSLKKLYQKDFNLVASGRTDAGVHALAQKVSFKVDNSNIPVENLPIAINSFLPEDIRITFSSVVEENFHARFSAKNKTYQYKILNSKFPIPQLRNYTYYFKRDLDFEKIYSASKYFLGTHDFVGFSSKGGNVLSTVKTLYTFDLEKKGDIISLYINGNSFLYNMVRIIVGTLVLVGTSKISLNDVEEIILSKNRKKAGPCAPAQGLTLMEVNY